MSDGESTSSFVGGMAHGFLKSFLKEKKKDLKNYFVKNKVGFLPEGMDFSNYKSIKNKNSYKQLKYLIGKHQTLGIIILGMHISTLTLEQRRDCILKHRQEVYDKYGPTGVSILNMAKTGFIDVYIKWLTDYNVEKNPSQKELINIYEKILEEWQEISIFIQLEKQDLTIKRIFFNKIASSLPFILVFASERAIKKWKNILNEIKKDGTLNEYDYNYNHEFLDQERKEMVWIFQHNPKE